MSSTSQQQAQEESARKLGIVVERPGQTPGGAGIFQAAPGLEALENDDFTDIPLPKIEILTGEQASGYIPITFRDVPETFYIRQPKIKRLIELFHMSTQYDQMSEEERGTPEGLLMAVSIIQPFLNKVDTTTGRYIAMTADELSEVIDLDDVPRIMGLVYPQIKPGKEMVAAGLADPKVSKSRARKRTGQ